jgi:hypothetical protein
MFMSLPPTTKQHWVYDDPSGVAEPVRFLRPWRRRARATTARVTVLRNQRVRVTHVEN